MLDEKKPLIIMHMTSVPHQSPNIFITALPACLLVEKGCPNFRLKYGRANNARPCRQKGTLAAEAQFKENFIQ